MIDDLTDDQRQLVSAYLDGDVTPDQRALVDADPALQAAVDQLRQIRSALSDAPTPAISIRERHLAAALSAWDNLPAAERVGQTSGAAATADDVATAAIKSPTPLAPRRTTPQRSPWLLSAAAGLLIVAGGAVVAVGALSGGNDDGGSNASVEVASEGADTAAETETETDAGDAPADESLAAAEEAVIASDDLRVAAGSGEALLDSGENRPGDSFDRIADETALVDYARRQLAEQDAATESADPDVSDGAGTEASPELAAAEEADAAATAFDPFCDGLVDRIIGDIDFGEGIYPIRVAVGVDEGANDVVAYEVDTCDVVARVTLGD